MLSLTWPQYLRRELSLSGSLIKLSSIEMEVFLVLYMNQGKILPISLLSSIIHGAKEDGGPMSSESDLRKSINSIRRKIGSGLLNHEHGRGYYLL